MPEDDPLIRALLELGCDQPDVVAPNAGTWPTCSAVQPFCVGHRSHALIAARNNLRRFLPRDNSDADLALAQLDIAIASAGVAASPPQKEGQ